jgi:DNA topoisomerase-3
MQLYICEKPSQAKDYANALGIAVKKDGYYEKDNIQVTWAIGHLLETAKPKDYDEKYGKWSLEHLPLIPEKWKLLKNPRTKKQYQIISKLLKSASEVVIATDADRERELIAVSILEENNYKGNTKRVLTGSLDKISLKKAIADMKDGKKTYPLYLAGVARQRADWLVGMNITMGLTTANKGKIDGFFSVGRVQTPTLSIIVARDLEIESFISKDYYEMNCLFSHPKGDFTGKWQIPSKYLTDDEGKYCLDKTIVDSVVKKIKDKKGIITKSQKVRKKEKAPLPYSLDSLRKDGSSKFGMSGDKVLDIAQSLYETHKATTYPRSDSQHLPLNMFGEVTTVINAVKGTDPSNTALLDIIKECNLKQKSDVWNDKKVEAHHAIIPTLVASNISKMSSDEVKIYDLIRRNYIAQFLPLAENDSTTLEVECESEKFKTTGSVPVKKGWKVLFSTAEKKEDELPLISEGEEVLAKNPKTESKKTKPPARFNDGSINDAMKDAGKFVDNKEFKKQLKESKGIGTVATRGNIIKTLFDRDYLKREKKNIISTDKGRSLISCTPKLTRDVATTAYWETELDKISKGTLDLDTFMENQRKLLGEMIDDIKSGKCTLTKSVGFQHHCPNCKSGLKRLKYKKTQNYFWVCINSDKCKTFLPDNRGKPGAPPEKLDQGSIEHSCSKCSTKLIRKKGQYGIYWHCSDTVNCKTIYNDVDGKPVAKKAPEKVSQGTVIYNCNTCSLKSQLERKKGQYGFYWQCTNGKCRQNHKEKDDKPIISIHSCPNCKKGSLLERKSAKGAFWGCNQFPKCKTIFQDDNGKPKL